MINLLAGLKLFMDFDKELRKMNNAIKQTDTKFCIKFHTHDYSITGYFTGFYRVKGEEYIGNNSDFNNTNIKFFTVKNVYKKAENLFFDFGFENHRDCIYVCDQTGKKIKRYDGVDWSTVL